MDFMSHTVFCPCVDVELDFGKWEEHFISDEHMDWLTSSSHNLNEVNIICACGGTYDYSTCHNHFKSAIHQSWQKYSKSKYNNVLILCKCGDITTFKDRSIHNQKHIMPIFADD